MRRKQKDHLARQQQAAKVTGGDMKALAVILLGVVIFGVSLASMGGDTFGVQSSRGRMGVHFQAWVTLNGRPVPSVTAVIGIAVVVWGIVASNRTHARRAPDRLS